MLSTAQLIDTDTVRDICATARKWAEAYGHQHKYSKTLAGLCAISSAKLFELLQNQGYLPSLCVWHDRRSDAAHCFVALGDHLLDITATQFGHPYSVAVVPRCSAKLPQWKVDLEFYALDDFMAYQREYAWEHRNRVTDAALSWAPRGGIQSKISSVREKHQINNQTH